MHLEHAVLELRSHLLSIGVFRKGEAARKAPIGALHAVILPAFLLLLKHPLSRDGEHIVLNRHLHVLFLDLGKLGLDEIFIVIFHDVHYWRPLGHRQCLILRAVFADWRAAKQGGESALQLVQFPERIPTGNGVHTATSFRQRVFLMLIALRASLQLPALPSSIILPLGLSSGRQAYRVEASDEAGLLTDAKPVLGERKIRARREPGRSSGPGPSACSRS